MEEVTNTSDSRIRKQFTAFRYVRDGKGNVQRVENEPRPSSVLVENVECHTCHNVFARQWFDDRLLFSDLTRGSEAGCEHCYAITEAVKHFCSIPSSEGVDDITTWIKISTGTRLLSSEYWSYAQLRVTNKDAEFSLDEATCEIQLYMTQKPANLGGNLKYIPVYKFFSGDTSSESTIDQVKEWLKTCQSDHSECQVPDLKNWLPTRTIFLGLSNSDIRLSENPLGSYDRYVCLSHCWGNPMSLKLCKTTTSTLEVYCESIPWDLLPLSFQEAIDFTRRMGFLHLWIDSLCIIQDDEDDWARQSSVMASIYSRASLTIAAVASKNGDEGLYRFNPPLEIAFKTSLHLESVFARLNTHEGPLPLLSRGWTFQEERLSKRIVYFTKHELVWKCLNKATKCQCSDGDRGEFLGRKSAARVFLDDPCSNDPVVALYNTWNWDVVREYSYRNLTVAEDKLPALSGLARRFQGDIAVAIREYGYSPGYFAGLWGDDILEQLLWVVRRPAAVTETDHVYVAPTWSWASINGPIDFRYFLHPQFHNGRADTQYSAHPLDVVCIPATSDMLGRLSGGHLRLSSAVFPCRVFRKRGSLKLHCVAYPQTEGWGSMKSGVEFHNVFLDHEITNSRAKRPWFSSLSSRLLITDDEIILQDIVCVVVKIRTYAISCLLLETIDSTGSLPIYRRVGLAEDSRPMNNAATLDFHRRKAFGEGDTTVIGPSPPFGGQFWAKSFIQDIMNMPRRSVMIV